MKNLLKKAFFGLFACSILFVVACASPEKYLITVNPSDSSLGSVLEASDVNLNEKDEGTRITLNAKENKGDTNPFICWVKDYNKVVGTEKQLELTYNAQTSGNYTAVFSEINSSKMMFASLSNIILSSSYNILEYEVTSYKGIQPSVFASGRIELSETATTYETDNTCLLYFGSAGANFDYEIRINLKFSDSLNPDNTATIPYSFQSSVNKSSFGENGTCTITGELPVINNTESDISLTFTKLDYSMFH